MTPTGRDQVERRWLGWLVGAVFGAYLLHWWNQYYAPNNGGDVTVMAWFLRDRLPYRDYYIHQPPGALMLLELLARVFGVWVIPYMVVGLTLRVCVGVVLFRLVSARRDPVVTAFLTVVGAVLACSDDSETVAQYHHMSVGLVILAAAAAYPCVMGQLPVGRGFWGRSLLAGGLMASALLLKQTTGALAFAGMVAIAAFAMGARKSWRALAHFVGMGAVGTVAVLGVGVAWLWRGDMLAPFFHMVFVVAPRAKGGVLTSLLRPLTQTFELAVLLRLFALAVALALFAGAAARLSRKAEAPRTAWRSGALLLLLLLGAMGLGSQLADWSANVLRMLLQANVDLVFFGIAALLGYQAVQFWKDRTDDRLHSLYTLGLGFLCSYSLSVSWPAFEPMLFPALAIVGVEADLLLRSHPQRTSVRTGMVTYLVLCVTLSSYWRHATPFRWAYWAEPPTISSNTTSAQPALQGITMSKFTAQFIDAATGLIKANSAPGDTVLLFPHFMLLAGLADRDTAGFAPIHWFDTCPDEVAIADADAIRQKPPAVIIALDLPDWAYEEQEQFFRGGKRSGQRELHAAMMEIVERDHYKEMKVVENPVNHMKIHAWVRPRP